MRDLLYLAHRIPYPPNKGDKVRAFHQIRHLGRRFRVHLGAFIDDPEDRGHVSTLEALCGQTFFPGLPPELARLASLRGLARGEALSLAYYRHAALSDWVARLLATLPIRCAVAYSSPMAQYLRAYPQLTRVADFVDVDSEKWRQYSKVRSWPASRLFAREGARLAAFEREIALEFDATLLASPQEADLLRQHAPESASRIDHVCNGVDADFFSPHQVFESPFRKDEPAIVFTGVMDYWPNVDAARWFATEVFPRVRRRHPDSRFWIVGSRPSSAVKGLGAMDGVTVTGGVQDVRPYLAHAHLAVAPLRVARGVQNKVLEAMAMAKAVVTSREAAEGIAARADAEILVASGSEEFAEVVARFLVSDSRHGVGTAARVRVLESYSWPVNLGRLDAHLPEEPERS